VTLLLSTTGSARSLPDDPVSAAEGLIADGRAVEAATLLRCCVEANRGGLLLRLTLQKALAAAGDSAGALAAAREMALLYPDAAPAALALGEALRQSGHLPAAIGEYQRALRLDPELDAARMGLGCAWLDAGEAEHALDTWREIGTASSDLVRRIAEAEAVLEQPRSDARYVRHLFDQFAADYDVRMLDHLQYRAPAILRELAELVGLGGRPRYTILDLGCGTGLMGAAIHNWATRLDGVDLSPAMARAAGEREIYDEIFVYDVVEWLAAHDRNYDLVLAADTLVYLGDLAPVIQKVARVLAPRGHFLFTVERKDGDGFELGPRRRWRHSETYLRAEADNAGLQIAGLVTCAPRTEAGVPVDGLAAALRKGT
jgi:predicted TPR repeat methyltransferase